MSNSSHKAWIAKTAKQSMVLETVDLGLIGAEEVEVKVEHSGPGPYKVPAAGSAKK